MKDVFKISKARRAAVDAAAPEFGDPPAFSNLVAPWQPAANAMQLASLDSIQPTDLGKWIDRLRRAGVIADRRNSPDLFGQLSQGLRRPVDTVLCSALDTDPWACLNSALAARYPLELAAGMTVAGRVTGASRAAVLTDARVPGEWFADLRRACGNMGIGVEAIINDYPQAEPTLLLYSMLGRRLRPGRMPTDVGAIVLDAAAAVAIGRCALLDEPMLQVPLCVRDHERARSHYLVVAVGTMLSQACDEIKLPVANRLLLAGDLLRDVRTSGEYVIGGGELIFHSLLPPQPVNPQACVRCGWCVDACPTRVQPAAALEAAAHDDIGLAERAGIEACIECGICSYVCPSNLPLLQGIRKMKLVAQHNLAETANRFS